MENCESCRKTFKPKQRFCSDKCASRERVRRFRKLKKSKGGAK